MSRQFRAIAIVVALAAIAYAVIAHRHHRDILGVPHDVLVATKVIRKGTPGDLIRSRAGYYKLTSVPPGGASPGAITDPAALAGKVALVRIDPGEVLAMAEFGRDAAPYTPGP